jgi:FkbM family methyltransferase
MSILSIVKRSFLHSWLEGYRLRRSIAPWTEQDERMLGFYSRLVRPGDLCFDIGANLGNRTRILRRLGARVVAVEPQPALARVLRAMHRRDDGVTVVESAVGEAAGDAELMLGNAHVLSSLSAEWIAATQRSGRFARSRWEERVQVRVTTLDALITENGVPDFVKIDVEGFEAPVVRGLSRAIPLLSLEFTPEWLDSTLECLERLSLLGTLRVNYSLGESMAMALDTWVTQAEIVAALERYRGDTSVFGDVYVRMA